MSESIIDDPKKLLSLSDAELREVLLDEKYNKSNLRALVRRCLKVANEYKTAFEYEISEDKKRTDEFLKHYD